MIVQLFKHAYEVRIEVRNRAAPIAPKLLTTFSERLERLAPNVCDKSGLGLGLHVAQAIARGHGGDVEYNYVEPHVVFTARLPIVRAESD